MNQRKSCELICHQIFHNTKESQLPSKHIKCIINHIQTLTSIHLEAQFLNDRKQWKCSIDLLCNKDLQSLIEK
jgi:hypothetical protein